MTFVKPPIRALTLMLVMLAIPSLSAAQEQAEGLLFVQVECMKSTSIDYANVEMEIWKPIHQEAVNQNKMVGWSLYWVLYGDRSDCDYYTVNSYRGLEQLNAEQAHADYFASAHPGKNWDEAWKRTAASRTHVRSELWVLIDEVPATDYRFVVVNQKHAEDGAEYVQFEQETWKPVHQALVDEGHTAGWALYALAAPNGSSIPYNYGTVDFLKRLGPIPFAETMASVHPEKDVDTIFQEGLDVHDHLYGETWMLLARTE